jgi:penicillin-binding protein 1C
MQGVSGVTGAGPLLHRAVMAVAQRIPPGELTTPSEVGALSVPVCRLSGLRATGECAQLAEWFARGTEPTRTDDWEHGGRVTLPDEYAEWSRQGLRPAMEGITLAGAGEGTSVMGVSLAAAAADAARDSSRRALRFHIASPADGDRYAIPAGVDARYSTIPLHASGPGATAVRWWVDGKPYIGERWPLAPGRHVISARSAHGETAEARIDVVR